MHDCARQRSHVCVLLVSRLLFSSFFFNDPATTEIYTLSLHDALPILVTTSGPGLTLLYELFIPLFWCVPVSLVTAEDRKSTRLNSSHRTISYAVFCLKKKKKKTKNNTL